MISELFSLSRRPPVARIRSASIRSRVSAASRLRGTEERLQFGAVQQGGSAITRICLHAELSGAHQAVQLGPADLVFERRVSDIEIFRFCWVYFMYVSM
ncbi:MAG: hypothetical protein OTJ97_04045 [SAR202 cluster bacterium]|nr:hypothetical protein [SAR202 cluster bacterium]